MMKSLMAVVSLLSLMGLSCEDQAIPTTVSVQYVNNTGLQVLFEIVDATNTKVASYSMGPRDFTNAADPVTTVTGVLPMIVDIPFVNPNTGCGIPPIIGINPSQAQLMSQVSGKIVRLEATAMQTLECVVEEP